jgi:hypothetical protein
MAWMFGLLKDEDRLEVALFWFEMVCDRLFDSSGRVASGRLFGETFF